MKSGFILINNTEITQIGNQGETADIACHCTHLPKGCDMEDISKSQFETVDFHLKCISREE